MKSLIVDITCWVADATKRQNISATRSSASGSNLLQRNLIVNNAVDINTPTVATITVLPSNTYTVIHTKKPLTINFTASAVLHTLVVTSDLVLSTPITTLTLSNADIVNEAEVFVAQMA